jgi:hypothetical protein
VELLLLTLRLTFNDLVPEARGVVARVGSRSFSLLLAKKAHSCPPPKYLQKQRFQLGLCYFSTLLPRYILPQYIPIPTYIPNSISTLINNRSHPRSRVSFVIPSPFSASVAISLTYFGILEGETPATPLLLVRRTQIPPKPHHRQRKQDTLVLSTGQHKSSMPTVVQSDINNRCLRTL